MPARLFATRWHRWLEKRIPPARQVRLDQRRIFILPTPQGLMFGLALLLMLLAAINYQNSLAYGLTFLLLSLGLVTILHTYRNLAGLVLAAGEAPPVFAGEQAGFRLRLQSNGRAHRGIALGWPPAPLQAVEVEADGSSEMELFLPASQRGWLRAPRLRVESRFPLGLLVAWSWVDLDLAALVYPRPLSGELPPAGGGVADDEEPGMASTRSGVDDFQGLRPYQSGDSRRRLHWKAWSRGQGLLVKDFAELQGHDLWLDFDSLGGDREARLSLLCHWVVQLAGHEQPFGLRLPGVSRAPGSGALQRELCLRELALFGLPANPAEGRR
ncbi:MAG: DUF58 domain-containing protein [Pseudomonas sagittaria]|nr:DUF58 domain-containing protein [Pseudomonas sagittaria]